MKHKPFNINHLTSNKIFFVFLLTIICYLLNVKSISAAPFYPIPELGNCTSVQECNLYCQIPVNTPACWSYGKYIMNNPPQVLGDTTVNITYPIAELGNCASAQECFIYCSQPANQEACLSYARNNGLVKQNSAQQNTDESKIVEDAKTELGCDSKDSCMALCNDPNNMTKCQSFAQKHGLEKEHTGPSAEVIGKAKTELGCDSATSCSNFCQNPQNSDKCLEFAKSNNLIDEGQAKQIETMRESRKKMLETAKSELGCDSPDSCYKLCQNPDNQTKCMNMAQKNGMTQNAGGPQGSGRFGNMNQSAPPCASETECKNYCQAHPDQCPGFSNPQNFKNINTLANPSSATSGGYIGPAGCRSEEECRSYCQVHPDQCPGFPKTSSGNIQIQNMPNTPNTPQIYNQYTHPTNYQNYNQDYKPPSPPPNQQFNQQSGSSFAPPTFPKDDNGGKYQNAQPSFYPPQFPK